MTFDDLFPLLLFIIFIGLPMLNRMQQRGRGGAPPGSPPGRGQPGAPGQPRQPPRQPGPAGGAASAEEREREARAGGQRTAPAGDDPFAELARRLEDARRRVRDAGSAQQAGTGTAPTGAPPAGAPPAARRTIASAGASQPPTRRPTPPPRPQRSPPPPRDPFPKGRPKPPAPWEQRTPRRPRLKEDAPALEVERRLRAVSGAERQARAQAREAARDLLSLDPRSVRKGVLWHMILGEPVGYRNRRKPSPLASR